MFVRVMSFAIVLFWAGTTAWLARSVWFESDARFEPVDPEQALGAFFRWNETSNLAILENDVRIGQMVVSGYEGVDPRSGLFTRGLSTQGTLDGTEGGQPGDSGLTGAAWRMTADFDSDTEMEALELVLRLPRQALNLRIELAGDPPETAARLTVGGLTVFETGTLSVDAIDGGPSRRKSNRGGTAEPALPLEESPGWMPGGALLGNADAWRPRIEAGRGFMEIAGSPQPVYLVKIYFGEGNSGNPVKLYLSEAGEPWKIDTGWGFEAVAEVLIPVEALTR